MPGAREPQRKKIYRRLRGVVASDKMQKTVTVTVLRTTTHPKYGKAYTVSKRYYADSGIFSLAEGDPVVIEACRPMSKTKRWRVIEKI